MIAKTHFVESLSEALLSLCPDGKVKGRYRAVVGVFGLTIYFRGGESLVRHKHGHEMPIHEVANGQFLIREGACHLWVDESMFKAFIKAEHDRD